MIVLLLLCVTLYSGAVACCTAVAHRIKAWETSTLNVCIRFFSYNSSPLVVGVLFIHVPHGVLETGPDGDVQHASFRLSGNRGIKTGEA